MHDAAQILVPLEIERQVVSRLKRGDTSAATQLYDWFGDRLYRQVILPRLPNRERAEDVLMDSFRLALERIEQYRDQDRSIFFWLRRIAINRITDDHRRVQRTRRMAERVQPDRTVASAPPSPDHTTHAKEQRSQVDTALAQLNPRYAQALDLRLRQDRDRAFCAEALGVTLGNFDVILHRACKAFRKVYPS